MPSQSWTSVKAVVLGFFGALFGAILFTIAYAAFRQLLGVTFFRSGTTSNFLFIAFYSALFTVLGGYLAARVAKYAEYLHAGAVAALLLLTQLPFVGRPNVPAWADMLLLAPLLPFALLGGHLAKKRNDALKTERRQRTS